MSTLERAFAALLLLLPAVAASAQTTTPGKTFRDCGNCPEMVFVAAGRFAMGVPPGEEEREAVPERQRGQSVPQHPVAVKAFALGRFAVSRGEFGAFVREAGFRPGDTCWTAERGEIAAERSWLNPGYRQTDEHPVVCVNWEETQAYVGWLASRTGKAYRLASEAEWEFAARAGTAAARFWGDNAQACTYANVMDRTITSRIQAVGFPCSDGHIYTAPVGSFRPNTWGLHDMLGNVWQWLDDCWNPSYAGAPTDGRAWMTGDCKRRLTRGGSWLDLPWLVRAGARGKVEMGLRDSTLGFRVARGL